MQWSANEPKGAALNCYLIFGYLMALGLFAFVRPRWRQLGPSLLDSYAIGLSLFSAGSILVWVEGLPDSEAVMRIAVAAALSGALGASLSSFLLAPRIAGCNFLADTRKLVADPTEHLVITVGFVIASVVSLIMLIAVFSHEHIRSLLLDAVLGNSTTLNEARIIVSSGAEGYFAPGYVKQFRDIVIPILCVAAMLCEGTYRHKGVLFAALLIAVVATFVSGQRLVIIQFILCLGTPFLIDRYSPRPHLVSFLAGGAMLLVLLGTVGVMTKMLGRMDVPLSPLPELQRQALSQNVRAIENPRLAPAVQEVSMTAEDARDAQVVMKVAMKEGVVAEAGAANSGRNVSQIEKSREPPVKTKGLLELRGMPTVVLMSVALVHRAVIAVPRENTLTFSYWSTQPHAPGSGWRTDLGGIRPGTQGQLSNELSEINKGGSLGNSPLGLATDVYYNWGWLGVWIVPAIFALGFLWLDVALTASRTPLTSAAKIFMFFSIPLMYSPFMFALYGGFVAVGTLCYARLRRRGAFSFIEMRLQNRHFRHSDALPRA